MSNVLCSGEWHDELCTMWPVAVGFQKMLSVKSESILVIVISRKLNFLFSFSMVYCSVGWIILKSV
jgi:hypothetical protein